MPVFPRLQIEGSMNEPDRIARLEHDRRGYPIPWLVVRGEDGWPFFTINDSGKTWRALREQLCPICGERLGRWRWFVGGPRSAFDEKGWYLDLPMHHECATYALGTCPHLAAPKYLNRADVTHADKLLPEHRVLLDQTVSPDRPEVFVATASDRVEMMLRDPVAPLLRPARPLMAYEFWRHGKQISWDEARPLLQAALGAEWTPPELRG
jgi:hypothetical protein